MKTLLEQMAGLHGKRLVHTANCRCLSPVIFLVLFQGCSTVPASTVSSPAQLKQAAITPPARSFSYGEHLGVAKTRPEGSNCLAIQNPDLADETKVTLVRVADFTQTPDVLVVTEARVGRHQTSACDGLIDAVNEKQPTVYEIHLPPAVVLQQTTYVAIVNPSRPISFIDGRLDADLDGDGVKETFRGCTSAEGFHYQVWSGEPLNRSSLAQNEERQ